jgi:hypothetical protein
VGTKRESKPAPPVVLPVDRTALGAALRLFVTRFVIEDKREQMHKRLFTAERRAETLVALERWIAGTKTELAGADRSPAGLEARFGAIMGVHLDEAGARRTTIAGALELGRSRASLFVGDSGRIALLTASGGAPILCSVV